MCKLSQHFDREVEVYPSVMIYIDLLEIDIEI